MLLVVLVVAAILGYVLVDHDAALYRDMTVVKITDISTEHTETQSGVLADKENYYVQTITATILNGEYKGKTATFSNQYTDSNVRDETYVTGDQLLVDLSHDGTTGKILEQKRDTLVYLFVAVLLIGLIAVADQYLFAAHCAALLSVRMEYHGIDGLHDFAIYDIIPADWQWRQPSLSAGNCCYAAFHRSHGGDLFSRSRGLSGSAVSDAGVCCRTG